MSEEHSLIDNIRKLIEEFYYQNEEDSGETLLLEFIQDNFQITQPNLGLTSDESWMKTFNSYTEIFYPTLQRKFRHLLMIVDIAKQSDLRVKEVLSLLKSYQESLQTPELPIAVLLATQDL